MLKSTEERVLSQIDGDEVVEFLRELVGTPSEFPPGDCRKVAQICSDAFERSGIPHQMVVPAKGVETPFGQDVPAQNLPSIVARVEGKSDRPLLLYNAHYDTVPVGDLDFWDYDPFGAELVDGKLYGRGAGDDKSSVAAQIMAAKAIAESGVELRGTLVVNPVADEEACSFRGTKWLLENGHLHPDMVVIGEQTGNHAAIAERAMIWLELVVHGVPSHGAMPWRGENAIVKMAQALARIEEDLTLSLTSRQHPYLPHSTLNVSMINGGVKENVVPERCRAVIDRRIVPGEDRETVLDELYAVLDRSARQVGGIRYEINVIWDGGSPVDTDPDSELVRSIQLSMQDISGEERSLVGYKQGSDGRLFAEAGIPIVIFGPSDPEVGHSPNEYVAVDQLIEATEIYALSALRLLDADSP